MRQYLEELRRDYAAPIDEERVWMAAYGRSVEVQPEEIRSVVESYAESVEGSFNAVVDIFDHEPAAIGIRDEREVILAVIVGRSADKDVVERALDPIDYEIRDTVHRLDRDDGGEDE